jgi:glyoxylase I family protein
MFAGLHHCNVVVSDLDRSKTFYTEVLGLTLAEEVEAAEDELSRGLGVPDAKLRAAFFDLPDSTTQVEMIQYIAPDSAPLPAGRLNNDVGYGHLAFRVEDIDAEYERLLSHGVEFISSPVTLEGGLRFCWFRDPDGNTLEIIQPA